MMVPQETITELRSEVMRLQMALANIAAIELDQWGEDWCEIREAQAIANRALNGED
jgi:hypothetical protein